MRRVRLATVLSAGLLVTAGALAAQVADAGVDADGPGAATPAASALVPAAGTAAAGPPRLREADLDAVLDQRAGLAVAASGAPSPVGPSTTAGGATAAGGAKQTPRDEGKTVRYQFDTGLAEPIWDEARTLPLRTVGLNGGTVEARLHGDGQAAGFPQPCRVVVTECPRVVLETDPAAWLNPDQSDVSWGALVLLDPEQTTDGENLVQKGRSTQGTQFKLQVDHYAGLPSCVVAGTVFGVNRIYIAEWHSSIADGAWHKLDCVRRGSGLALFVDGEMRAGTVIPSQLSIVNPDPLRLGGKGIGPWNDQFHGLLDDVYVTVG